MRCSEYKISRLEAKSLKGHIIIIWINNSVTNYLLTQQTIYQPLHLFVVNAISDNSSYQFTKRCSEAEGSTIYFKFDSSLEISSSKHSNICPNPQPPTLLLNLKRTFECWIRPSHPDNPPTRSTRWRTLKRFPKKKKN